VDALALQPAPRLAAGIAVRQAINDDAIVRRSGPGRRVRGVGTPDQSQRHQLRNSSLIDVLPRVFSSTRLTITAAYRLWLPSAAGRLPATTTLPAGTRP